MCFFFLHTLTNREERSLKPRHFNLFVAGWTSLRYLSFSRFRFVPLCLGRLLLFRQRVHPVSDQVDHPAVSKISGDVETVLFCRKTKYDPSNHHRRHRFNQIRRQMCSRTFLVLGVHAGARLDEEVHTGGVRALDGPHERRGSAEGLCVHGGPGLNQKLQKFYLASVSRVVERCPEELVAHIHIGPVRER